MGYTGRHKHMGIKAVAATLGLPVKDAEVVLANHRLAGVSAHSVKIGIAGPDYLVWRSQDVGALQKVLEMNSLRRAVDAGLVKEEDIKPAYQQPTYANVPYRRPVELPVEEVWEGIGALAEKSVCSVPRHAIATRADIWDF